MSNRIAHGLAAFCWGGKTVEALAPYSLGASDFIKHDYDAFEKYTVPADAKLENRPRNPATLYAWKQSATCQVDAWCMPGPCLGCGWGHFKMKQKGYGRIPNP